MAKIIEARAILSARDASGGAFAGFAAKLRGLEGLQRGFNTRMAASAGMVAARIGAIAGPAILAAGASEAVRSYAVLERKMTRIGITAETSGAAVKAATSDVQKLAYETAMPIDNVREGLDSLVSQGMTLERAMAFLPSVVRTAQAAGAETNDIATSAGAIGTQMGITAEKMQSAFDILAAAGKAGKFELKDMARYLPSLAPLAASVGLKGEEGLRRLAATAQVVRNQTGTAEEAASSLQNIFAKMESAETTKKFGKFGVDLRKEMDKARKGGKDLLTAFVELSDKALKGDLSKIPQLFTDMEFARGMRALLSQKGAVDSLAASLRGVDGTTLRDLNTVLATTQTSIDRAGISWEKFKTSLGEKLAPAAAATLEAVNRFMNSPDPVSNTLFPNAALPPSIIPRAGTRAEGIAMEREARFGVWRSPLAGFAEGRAAERAVADDPDYFNRYGPSSFQVAEQRRRAIEAGGMTPGMSIERENEIDALVRGQADFLQNNFRKRFPYLSADESLSKVAGRMGTRELVEERDRLEAVRTGRPRSSPEEIDRTVKAELEGSASVDVKVEVSPSPDFISRIISQVTRTTGNLTNGPGSTGSTMPEASAPVHNIGRGDR